MNSLPWRTVDRARRPLPRGTESNHTVVLIDGVRINPGTIGTHDYETLGHAAPGRGLNELNLGFYIAKSLDQWIPNTYVQARYNYAFVEQVVGVSHDRTNADLEVGYFVNPRFSIRVLYAYQNTHGGNG